MREIPLTQGFVALVDDADYSQVMSAGKWFAHKGRSGLVYARRNSSTKAGPSRTVHMHSFIYGGSSLVDHVNGNGLDNRRANLRQATHEQNARNRKMRTDATSGFKGVGRNKSTNRPFFATICLPGNQHKYLGGFESPELAAHAYDAAAIQHFGEFARLNFPKGTNA